jgi:hypothetical protein
MKNIRKRVRSIAKNVVELLYGIPAAKASKKRAEAAYKWIECYTKYFDFIKKINLPANQKRRIMMLLEAAMRKHIVGR